MNESRTADRPGVPARDFGERLRTLRTDRGLSLADLSARVHYSKGYLSKVENGDKPPTVQLARGCDQALGADGSLLRMLIGPATGQQSTVALKANRPGARRELREPTPRPAQLPAAVADFAGRGEEIGRLDAMLASSNPAGMLIVIIDGLGGIGKTTLALHWAHKLRARFPDGALFADLRGYHPTGVPASPSDILAAFLRALGVAPNAVPRDDADRAALFRSAMDGKRMLLVLDDASDTEQVEPLLPGSPGCLVLVTTRTRLSGLMVRHGARRLGLGGLAAAEAMALLGGIVGHQRVAEEVEAANELVTRCARLPLALRIAADRAASRPERPLADLVAELRSEGDRLAALSVAGDDTAAVAGVFSCSYRALPEEEARVFRLLGLFPGLEPSVPATAALLGTNPATARHLLDSLTTVHLVEESGRDGYRLHELVRLYAAERARAEETEEARDAALARLATWYLHTADKADRELMPQRWRQPLDLPSPVSPPEFEDYASAMAWCEAERSTLIQLIRELAARRIYDLAWRLATAMLGFLSFRNRWTDFVETHEMALAAAEAAGDVQGQAIVLNGLAIAKANSGRPDEAHLLLTRAMALRKRMSDARGEAAVANNLGLLLVERGEPRSAIPHYERAITLFRQSSDRCAEGQAINNLGGAYLALGRVDEAIGCFQRALVFLEELCDRHGQAEALDSLGSAHQASGNYEAAVDCHLRAVLLFRELGDRSGEAGGLDNLGFALEADGSTMLAHDAWRQALELYEQTDPDKAQQVRTRLAAE